MILKDSGARRSFDSGAVRDIADGKGRCDLLPLDQVCVLLDSDIVIENISQFMNSGDVKFIHQAIQEFAQSHYSNLSTCILEVAKQYEDGCQKYGERNWEKGIPLHCYVDSGVRHYLKVCRGDDDEPHDRAFVWNMLGLLWTLNHHPELNDLPFNENNK